MPNAVARRAKKPLATSWSAEDDDFVVVADEFAAPTTGVPVATAPTPPVTGPLSLICKLFEAMSA